MSFEVARVTMLVAVILYLGTVFPIPGGFAQLVRSNRGIHDAERRGTLAAPAADRRS